MTLAASCASENSDIRSKDYMFENLSDGAPGLTQMMNLKDRRSLQLVVCQIQSLL